MAISVRALRGAVLTAVLAAAVSAGTPAFAQGVQPGAYPNKPIRIIVPYPPGSGTEFTAREMGKGINEAFGQPVVMDNRPGAGATLGHALMSKATPDGYTLGLGTTGGLVSGPALMGNRIPYDPLKDFAPITRVAVSPSVLAAAPTLPVNNLQEFVSLVKANPGFRGCHGLHGLNRCLARALSAKPAQRFSRSPGASGLLFSGPYRCCPNPVRRFARCRAAP